MKLRIINKIITISLYISIFTLIFLTFNLTPIQLELELDKFILLTRTKFELNEVYDTSDYFLTNYHVLQFSSLDTTILGYQKIEVVVEDKEVQSLFFDIEIVDESTPQIIFKQDHLIIYDNFEFNILDNVEVLDNDENVIVYYEPIQLKVGENQIKVTAIDQSLNKE